MSLPATPREGEERGRPRISVANAAVASSFGGGWAEVVVVAIRDGDCDDVVEKGAKQGRLRPGGEKSELCSRATGSGGAAVKGGVLPSGEVVEAAVLVRPSTGSGVASPVLLTPLSMSPSPFSPPLPSLASAGLDVKATPIFGFGA